MSGPCTEISAYCSVKDTNYIVVSIRSFYLVGLASVGNDLIRSRVTLVKRSESEVGNERLRNISYNTISAESPRNHQRLLFVVSFLFGQTCLRHL